MRILDKDKAKNYLKFINYYRLSGYTFSFEQFSGKKRTHQFLNVTFEDVIALYDFDRRLRILVMDAIERIEPTFRTNVEDFCN